MSKKTIFENDVDTNVGLDDKIEEPRLYKVVLLNDDYTTMDFVTEILMIIFHKTKDDAVKIMLDVHNKGKGIVGIYSYDIAVTKIKQTEEMAIKNGFPLKAELEEE